MSGESKKRLNELFDDYYAADIISDSPCVHLYGTGRAEVEGCRGVLSFSDELLALSMKRHNIIFRGERLAIEALTKTSLVVTGRIMGLEITERGKIPK